VKQELMNLYSIRDFNSIIYYLGLNMVRDKKARIIYFTQIAAIDRILEEAGMAECSSYTTPMESGLQLEEIQNSSQIVDQRTYTQKIGKLLHLTINTRSNIAQTVERLTQFNSNSDRACWTTLKYLLRYLKGTRTKDIIYKFNSNSTTTIGEDTINIIGYSDSDWAGDSFINHFTTGYIFMNAGNSII
jgi:hypothetical protein